MSDESCKRRDIDVTELMRKGHEVKLFEDRLKTIAVTFHGPAGSYYEGGIWKIYVDIPDDYPNKPPTIVFARKIYHPNISEDFGTVCMDVLGEKWSSKNNLSHIFEYFLPHLLQKPNSSDPCYGEAANLMINDREEFVKKVKEYIQLYATKEVLNDPNSKSGYTEDDSSGDDNPPTDQVSGAGACD